MTSRTVVFNVAINDVSIAIDYAVTSDVRDNASTGSAVVLTHRLEIEKANPQYRDEVEEIEEKLRDLIVDVLEDFEVAEPVDLADPDD